MAVPVLDLSRQHALLGAELTAAIESVIEAQRFIMGPQVAELEAAVAAKCGLDHSIAVASGTDALLLPLRALDPEPGDEAVVPAFTFFATAGAVWNAGFKPAFCDVDPRTYNVTPETVDAVWGERTRAVVPVHLFGQMAPMEPLMRMGRERSAVVIEDAAQCMGATQLIDGKERSAGSLGDASSFSFFPTKNLGGFGDGGLVAARDEAIAERVRLLRTHGGRKMYHHEFVGTNSRLDTLQAALLLAKLPHLDSWVDARRRNAARYCEMLGDVEGIILPLEDEGNRHSYNQFTVRAERRDQLREYLTGRGIGSGLYYPVPLHLQECFAELGYRRGDLPVAEALCSEVVSLPIFPELRTVEQEEVVAAVRSFYGAS